MRILIFGCGYVGRRAAGFLAADGHTVHAVTRSFPRAAEWEARGWKPIVADVMRPESLAALPTVDIAIYAVASDRLSNVSKRDLAVTGLSNALRSITGACGCVVFVSTTSVYGQTDGEIINEESPTEPVSDSGRIALDAERVFARWREEEGRGTAAVTLRLAGLYGPDRLLARIGQLREGSPLAGDGDAWLNLIHRDDAARLAIKAARIGRDQSLYLGCDNEPVRRREFYACLARGIDAPEPVFDPALAGPDRGSSKGLNKRCSNQRIRAELNFRCAFPTYREGLADALSRTIV